MSNEQWMLLVTAAGAVVTWAGVGVTIYLARANRAKLGAEANSENAAAAKSYAEAAATYAKELKAVREDVLSLRREVDERDRVIREQLEQLEDVKDWADRLVHQVKSLGHEPVPFRQVKKAKEA